MSGDGQPLRQVAPAQLGRLALPIGPGAGRVVEQDIQIHCVARRKARRWWQLTPAAQYWITNTPAAATPMPRARWSSWHREQLTSQDLAPAR